MREIKFRVWHPSHIEGMDVADITDRASMGATFTFAITPASGCIIDQYTGLNDTCGVEIYEGDIVQLNDTHVRAFRRVIGFRECKFGYAEPLDERVWYSIEGRGVSQAWARWHVVGNIHENPELLKEE